MGLLICGVFHGLGVIPTERRDNSQQQHLSHLVCKYYDPLSWYQHGAVRLSQGSAGLSLWVFSPECAFCIPSFVAHASDMVRRGLHGHLVYPPRGGGRVETGVGWMDAQLSHFLSAPVFVTPMSRCGRGGDLNRPEGEDEPLTIWVVLLFYLCREETLIVVSEVFVSLSTPTPVTARSRCHCLEL